MTETRPSDIQLEISNHLAIMRLDAPERRNAITPSMARSMLDAIASVSTDSSIAALVIAASGEAFCAGADLATLSSAGADPASNGIYEDIGVIYQAFIALTDVPIPVIAAVRGPAIGAGLNLALSADLRIVAHDARLSSAFVGLGVHPGGAHFSLLTRLVGREAAMAIGVLGLEIGGRRAVEIGMAWESVEAAQVEERAIELARRLCSDPLLSRELIATFRGETAGAIPLRLAVQAERASQMWSFRRRHDLSGPA